MVLVKFERATTLTLSVAAPAEVTTLANSNGNISMVPTLQRKHHPHHHHHRARWHVDPEITNKHPTQDSSSVSRRISWVQLFLLEAGVTSQDRKGGSRRKP